MDDEPRYYVPPSHVAAAQAEQAEPAPARSTKLKRPTVTKVHKYMNPSFYGMFTQQQWEELKQMETLAGLIHQPGLVPDEVSLDAAQPIARVAPTRLLLVGSGRPFAGPLGKQAGHADV